jgi:chromosomal replication initiation ATPase DnaA
MRTELEQELLERGLLEDVRRICCQSGITFEELVSPSRRHPIPRVRGRVFKWLRDARGFSSVSIGRMFGKHHTTVLMAIRSLEAG